MDTRSAFVTVLAWIFIVGSGLFCVVTFMQTVMVTVFFSGQEIQQLPEDAPIVARLIAQYMHFFVYGMFALSVLAFVASIALLKRKNWARLTFVVLLGIGILWQVVGLALQALFLQDAVVPHQAEGFSEFEAIKNTVVWVSFIFALLVSGLFAWIIKRLLSHSVVDEFKPVAQRGG